MTKNEDAGFIPPNFFTNLMDEAIGETPDPPMIQQPTPVHGQSTRETADTGPFVATTNTTSVAGDENDDEALSQPNDPHVGMRYDSLELAREHYNAYAARTGFSIALNTNRRSAYTGLLEKQQFSCNKFRKPKNLDGNAEMLAKVGPIPDHESPTEEERQEAEIESALAEIADKGGKKKNPKLRKRENIVHTSCKAKLVVKLIDGRWEVMTFTPEHNHPLVQKPSLLKYMRSHQRIPKEEREFVKNLHATNLTAGLYFKLHQK
jgi:hypothetical protein